MLEQGIVFQLKSLLLDRQFKLLKPYSGIRGNRVLTLSFQVRRDFILFYEKLQLL